MTAFFDSEFLERHLSYDLALRAMEACFDAEADGKTTLPPRIDTPSGKGFIRAMPAVLDDVMGLKIMTLVEGIGNHYLILLYEVATGELLALFDADELTRLRTAAVTALAGNAMLAAPPEEIAIVGSGFEAVGHLRTMAHVWPLKRVWVYSPNIIRRNNFADAMSRELGIEVVSADSERDALRDQHCVVLATKSKQPVIDGNNLEPGCVVLSIGSTRLDLRELDDRALERGSILVVDDPTNVLHESADIVEGIERGVLDPKRMIALSQLRRGARPERDDGNGDVALFKSVGNALQDLALARMLYRDETMRRAAVELPELSRLKPFAAKAKPMTPA